MIVFQWGESQCVICVDCLHEANHCLSHIGVYYNHHKSRNDLLEVAQHQGEDEMSDEEYKQSLYPSSKLRLQCGGREFEPRMSGSGYVHGQNA